MVEEAPPELTGPQGQEGGPPGGLLVVEGHLPPPQGEGGEEEGEGSGGEGGGGLTCPTQGATLQPSRPEDTVQARTVCNRVLQKVCKPVKFFCFGETDKTVKEENLREAAARQQW